MNKFIVFVFLLFGLIKISSAQQLNPVLIEVFTETGCGACSANDSAFQAIVNANAEKVAVISYHCFYALDTFYQYNKACDERYIYYNIKGFPSAMTNGIEPLKGYSHLSYVTSSVINTLYNKPSQFKLDLSFTPVNKNNVHSLKIKVKTTALKDITDTDIRVFIAITENKINHEQRYHTKAVNGLVEFNNIFRTMLPDKNGSAISLQKIGNENTIKAEYINDDKEINLEEVEIIAYVQNMTTKEILGVAKLPVSR